MSRNKWEIMRDQVEAIHLSFYSTLTGVGFGEGIGCDEIGSQEIDLGLFVKEEEWV